MEIVLNGEATETACTTLGELLEQLNYKGDSVATAVDGTFLPRQQRHAARLSEGMRIEIVSPMQGG